MPDQLRNYINCEWRDAAGGAIYENRNPATGEVLHEVADSSPADVDQAVRAAVAAREAWRRTPAPRRAEILFRAAETLVRRKEELARDLVLEMGKVMPEALGDIQEAIDMTYFMAGEGRRLDGVTVPAELPNKFAMSVRQPVGVVAAITPWNFPVAIPSWKLMPALICGNTVVFKPSEWTPHCAVNLVRILEEAGLPPGVLNLVIGRGAVPGEALVEHPDVDLVSFTGSNAVGTHVATRCAQQGKRVSLEMGGKNPIIVMADADLDLALDGVIWSAFGTSGQRCTAASRVIVEESVRETFTGMLVEKAQALRLGSGLDPQTDVGPIINPNQLQKIRSYMPIATDEGASIACGGATPSVDGGNGGYWFQPTVLTNVRPKMRVAQEEIFGPVTAVIPAGSLDEAIAIANDSDYGLSSAIFTNDVNKAFRAIQELSTGLVYVNAGTIGAEIQVPFGGTRGTGNGHREAGTAALDTYAEWKSVFVDYSGHLQKAQIDA